MRIEANTVYVFKSNMTCLDCYNTVGKALEGASCTKNLILAVDKKESFYLSLTEFKKKVTKLQGFTIYFDKCDMDNLVEVNYAKGSLFKKCNITKTPYIITCNAAGKVDYWPYERIFYRGTTVVNDTLVKMFVN